MLAKPIRQKVFAYITHKQRLLIFRHPFAPEAGLQVPAGTLEAGEAPETGVMREAFEETGLSNLRFVSFLGQQQYDPTPFGRDEIHQRHFFHLCYDKTPPERWQHSERYPSKPSTKPIVFEFWWVSLPNGVPPLIAGHDAMVPTLYQAMHLSRWPFLT